MVAVMIASDQVEQTQSPSLMRALVGFLTSTTAVATVMVLFAAI
jgi:hypothetical protein